MTGGVRVGYHARGTNDLIPVTRCPLLVPELEALLHDLPAHLGDRPPAAHRPRGRRARRRASPWRPCCPACPHGEVTLDRRGHHLRLRRPLLLPGPPRPPAAPGRGHASAPGRGRRRYDLYAGVGLFSPPARPPLRQGDRRRGRPDRLPLRPPQRAAQPAANVEIGQPGRSRAGCRGCRRASTAWSPTRPAAASSSDVRKALLPSAGQAADLRLLPPRRPGPRPAQLLMTVYDREGHLLRPLPADRAHGGGGADGAAGGV